MWLGSRVVPLAANGETLILHGDSMRKNTRTLHQDGDP